MRIAIFGFSKIKYMPYLNFYLNSIDCTKNDVSVFYWNRDGKEDAEKRQDISYFEFNRFQQDDGGDISKLLKMFNFSKYKKFAKQAIKNGNFDLIILLHSMPAVLLYNTVKKLNYIFDYRDSTYERFGFFQKRIYDIVRNSKATFISSYGFMKYMPQDCTDKIFISHNISDKDIDYNCLQKADSDIIRISYWGLIRDKKINMAMINSLANDKRFELHYYGREQTTALELKKYVSSINAKNIHFHGEYAQNERLKFAQKTDIIHNIFDDSNMLIAMSNKFYDALVFNIPQICMSGSFMGKKAEENYVGKALNPYNENFANELYSYAVSYDKSKFRRGCNKLMSEFLAQAEIGSNVIKALSNSV